MTHLRVVKQRELQGMLSTMQSHPNATANTNLCLFEAFGGRRVSSQPHLILQHPHHAATQSPPCTCTMLAHPQGPPQPPPIPQYPWDWVGGAPPAPLLPGAVPCPATSTASQIQPHQRLAAAWGRLSISKCTAPALQHMIE